MTFCGLILIASAAKRATAREPPSAARGLWWDALRGNVFWFRFLSCLLGGGMFFSPLSSHPIGFSSRPRAASPPRIMRCHRRAGQEAGGVAELCGLYQRPCTTEALQRYRKPWKCWGGTGRCRMDGTGTGSSFSRDLLSKARAAGAVQPPGFCSRGWIFLAFPLCALRFGKRARPWEPAEKKLRFFWGKRGGSSAQRGCSGGRDRVWGRMSSR